VQSLQNFCLNKADQIRKSSVQPTELLALQLSDLLRR